MIDELWGYTSERSQRLFDEVIPSPARKVSGRLISSFAGFSGTSVPLERLYKRGLTGKEVAPDLHAQPGYLMYWTHRMLAPWQDDTWLEQQRASQRPTAFIRMFLNQFVTAEETFIELALYDKCVNVQQRPLMGDHLRPAFVGVDASTKRDSTAIVVCYFDSAKQKVIVANHKIFQPTPMIHSILKPRLKPICAP